MRFESSAFSISWIPSEAVAGAMKLPFETGLAHYDPPPPETVTDLEELRVSRPVPLRQQAGRLDRGRRRPHRAPWPRRRRGSIGSTTIRLGGKSVVFQAIAAARVATRPRGERRPRCASSRPRAAGPACLPRDGCDGRRSSNSARRWHGRRLRSPCAPTGRRAPSSSGRAPSPGTGSTATTAHSCRSPG